MMGPQSYIIGNELSEIFCLVEKKHEKVTNPLSDGQEHVDFAIFANAYLKVCSRFRDFQSSNKKKAFIGFLLRQQFWFRSMARGRPRGRRVYRRNSLGTEQTEGTVSEQASRLRPVYGPKLGSCQTTSKKLWLGNSMRFWRLLKICSEHNFQKTN